MKSTWRLCGGNPGFFAKLRVTGKQKRNSQKIHNLGVNTRMRKEIIENGGWQGLFLLLLMQDLILWRRCRLGDENMLDWYLMDEAFRYLLLKYFYKKILVPFYLRRLHHLIHQRKPDPNQTNFYSYTYHPNFLGIHNQVCYSSMEQLWEQIFQKIHSVFHLKHSSQKRDICQWEQGE